MCYTVIDSLAFQHWFVAVDRNLTGWKNGKRTKCLGHNSPEHNAPGYNAPHPAPPPPADNASCGGQNALRIQSCGQDHTLQGHGQDKCSGPRPRPWTLTSRRCRSFTLRPNFFSQDQGQGQHFGIQGHGQDLHFCHRDTRGQGHLATTTCVVKTDASSIQFNTDSIRIQYSTNLSLLGFYSSTTGERGERDRQMNSHGRSPLKQAVKGLFSCYKYALYYSSPDS